MTECQRLRSLTHPIPADWDGDNFVLVSTPIRFLQIMTPHRPIMHGTETRINSGPYPAPPSLPRRRGGLYRRIEARDREPIMPQLHSLEPLLERACGSDLSTKSTVFGLYLLPLMRSLSPSLIGQSISE